MKKVLVTDPFSQEGINIFHKNPDIELTVKVGIKKEELQEIINQYDALIVRSETKVTKELIEKADKLKIIGRAGVGVDNIDLQAATKRGIMVMNVPTGNTISTAEHTIGLILCVARKLPQAHIHLRSGKWERRAFVGNELYGKTLGIVGLGKVGSEVAKRAKAFGMKILAYDPYISKDKVPQEFSLLSSLEELVKESDFITLHIPYSSSTRHLFNKDLLSKMKRGSFLINTARGGIVDEEALYELLKEGHIKGAALDVYENEPPVGSPLLELDNVVAVPHLGASTQEAQVNVSIVIAEQIIDALEGKSIRNVVNLPPIEAGLREILQPYVTLAEKLGSFISQLISPSTIKRIEIDYCGKVSSFNTSFLTLATIKGILEFFLEDAVVNYVNAKPLAEERGIKIVETTNSTPSNFKDLISLSCFTDETKCSIWGTILQDNDLRIVKIDGFYVEAVPSGYLLVLNQRDEPGIIGKVGTILGNHQINIGWLQLSRTSIGGKAISVWNVDAEIPPQAINKIKEIKEISCVRQIKLNE